MNVKIDLIGREKIIMQNPDSKHNYFAWPTVAVLKNGKIAVSASGFRLLHVCPFGKSVISISEDDGETYSAPMPAIDTVLDDRDAGLCPFGDSGLIVTSFNNSVQFQRQSSNNTDYQATVNERRRNAALKAYIDAYLDTVLEEEERAVLGNTYRISCDNGVTFGPIFNSPITSPHGPIERRDHSILWVGTAHESENEIVAYTMDPTDGKMRYVGQIDTSGIKAAGCMPCEPYTVELDDGTLLCHIRADRYGDNPAFTLYQSESTDGGKAWSSPRRILEECGGAPSHMLKHSSGVLIAVYGYRAFPYGIKVMFSCDGGKSWSRGQYLCRNEYSSDLGYPSTVELADGSLLTVFYAHNGKNEPAVIFQQRWRIVNAM